MLSDTFSDDQNCLYFLFTCPVVREFERVSSLFQPPNAKPSHLFHELDSHFNSLLRPVDDEQRSLFL